MREVVFPFSKPESVWVGETTEPQMARFPEHARLLGIITAEWNAIEFHFVRMLALALDAQSDIVYPMAYMVIANKARLHLVHAAMKRIIKAKTHREALRKLLNRLSHLLDKRNKYAHAVYAHEKGKDLKCVNTQDWNMVTGQPKMARVTEQEMEAVINKMARLKADLAAFIDSEPWRARPRASRVPGPPKARTTTHPRSRSTPHTPPEPSPS